MSGLSKVGMIGALVGAILIAGCISKSGEIVKTETPTITPVPPSITVPPAPRQFYLRVGQSEQFIYWDHNITINYFSGYPNQIIKITLDGVEKTFQKELTENPIGIYWKEGNLSFTIKPVIWEIRNGQNIPVYESTWNTTEIYFKMQGMPISEITGGPQR